MVGQTFPSAGDAEKESKKDSATNESASGSGTGRNACLTDLDYSGVLKLCQHPQLARRIGLNKVISNLLTPTLKRADSGSRGKVPQSADVANVRSPSQ